MCSQTPIFPLKCSKMFFTFSRVGIVEKILYFYEKIVFIFNSKLFINIGNMYLILKYTYLSHISLQSFFSRHFLKCNWDLVVYQILYITYKTFYCTMSISPCY